MFSKTSTAIEGFSTKISRTVEKTAPYLVSQTTQEEVKTVSNSSNGNLKLM